ncbi:MAG: AAA family ATPase [Myxococcales bacterium]|nr:AAA family ATPase [Myxococcales bacterium]MCB9713328.1 AAA family ATPase [Myxococcales bacterium]
MSDRDQRGTSWPVTQLRRLPGSEGASPPRIGAAEAYEPSEPAATTSVRSLLHASLGELRRRWLLALVMASLVIAPMVSYALLAVPTYTSEGVLQVSAQGGAMSPLLELTGGGSRGDVETEVQIIRRRQFLLDVLRDLRLDVVDPAQPRWVTSDLEVAMEGRSPVSERIRRVRGALERLVVDPSARGELPLTITGLEGERVAIELGPPGQTRRHELGLGERLDDEPLSLQLHSMPVDPGETVTLAILTEGPLLDRWMPNLKVASLGASAQATNLVSIRFSHPDRETARAVVQRLMQRYLDQSLAWQALSASNSAEFIAQRLSEAEEQLREDEEQLRQFAEQEHAVRLDTQAEVTINSAADLEAEKRQIELQERVIGSVLAGLKKRRGSANLTSNFFEDPVLAANVAALTEAETERSVLRATLTDDHPRVVALDEQIRQRQGEITKLLRSAQRNLTSRRIEIDRELEESMSSLSAYPDKELELARRRRDVEVSQRLYSFLLEKFQEAEILEASTTTDKRIVDPAGLPHRPTSPARTILVLTGSLGGLIVAFLAVYLAHLLQRRLTTVEAVKEEVPYPMYGTVPAVGSAKATGGRRARAAPNQRLSLDAVWAETHGPPAEAFRALAVSVSLIPAVPGRGRLVQVTSSQPGEGKSTVISNLAISLAKAGARVLVIDLDLRKPVQHRYWGFPRAPGYSDLLARGSGPAKANDMLRSSEAWGVSVLTAGTKLPDTMGALMGQTLESMLAYWSERYDYVLLDSPPAFVSDAALLGRHADLILLVARPGVVERANLRQAASTLLRLEAAKGLVLNHVERKHVEYYYGGDYYYARAYESADDDRQAAS